MAGLVMYPSLFVSGVVVGLRHQSREFGPMGRLFMTLVANVASWALEETWQVGLRNGLVMRCNMREIDSNTIVFFFCCREARAQSPLSCNKEGSRANRITFR